MRGCFRQSQEQHCNFFPGFLLLSPLPTDQPAATKTAAALSRTRRTQYTLLTPCQSTAATPSPGCMSTDSRSNSNRYTDTSTTNIDITTNTTTLVLMPVSYPSETTAVLSPKLAFASARTTTTLVSDSTTVPNHRKRSSGSDMLPTPDLPVKRSASSPATAPATTVTTENAVDPERQRQGQTMMTAYISSAIREKKKVRDHCHQLPRVITAFS